MLGDSDTHWHVGGRGRWTSEMEASQNSSKSTQSNPVLPKQKNQNKTKKPQKQARSWIFIYLNYYSASMELGPELHINRLGEHVLLVAQHSVC